MVVLQQYKDQLSFTGFAFWKRMRAIIIVSITAWHWSRFWQFRRDAELNSDMQHSDNQQYRFLFVDKADLTAQRLSSKVSVIPAPAELLSSSSQFLKRLSIKLHLRTQTAGVDSLWSYGCVREHLVFYTLGWILYIVIWSKILTD